MDSRFRGNDVNFGEAEGDEESRSALKMLRARCLAEFTLSGRARFFAPLRMTSEGLRMILFKGSAAVSEASSPPTRDEKSASGSRPRRYWPLAEAVVAFSFGA